MKDTSIRIKSHTKERLDKYSKRLKLTHNELIELLINIGEKNNFEDNYHVEIIEKIIQKESNRVIGFIRTQDKMIQQNSDNLESVYKNIELNERKRHNETLEKITTIINNIRLINNWIIGKK